MWIIITYRVKGMFLAKLVYFVFFAGAPLSTRMFATNRDITPKKKRKFAA